MPYLDLIPCKLGYKCTLARSCAAHYGDEDVLGTGTRPNGHLFRALRRWGTGLRSFWVGGFRHRGLRLAHPHGFQSMTDTHLEELKDSEEKQRGVVRKSLFWMGEIERKHGEASMGQCRKMLSMTADCSGHRPCTR